MRASQSVGRRGPVLDAGDRVVVGVGPSPGNVGTGIATGADVQAVAPATSTAKHAATTGRCPPVSRPQVRSHIAVLARRVMPRACFAITCSPYRCEPRHRPAVTHPTSAKAAPGIPTAAHVELADQNGLSPVGFRSPVHRTTRLAVEGQVTFTTRSSVRRAHPAPLIAVVTRPLPAGDRSPEAGAGCARLLQDAQTGRAGWPGAGPEIDRPRRPGTGDRGRADRV